MIRPLLPALLIAGALLTGCGQKGPLVHPTAPPPAAPAAATAPATAPSTTTNSDADAR